MTDLLLPVLTLIAFVFGSVCFFMSLARGMAFPVAWFLIGMVLGPLGMVLVVLVRQKQKTTQVLVEKELNS